MCGRFSRSSSLDRIVREFGVAKTLVEPEASYNIAPGQSVVIVVDRGERQLAACRWGLLPSWAKDPADGYRMINARAETVAVKPAFKAAFLGHRCLVIADGFFEWQKGEQGKLPYHIRLRSGRCFGMAGLIHEWTAPAGEKTCTCAIVTTGANALTAQVHERMPVIIPRDSVRLWLDPAVREAATLLGLLRPYPAEEMEMYPVSPKVNSPSYNVPEAVLPAASG